MPIHAQLDELIHAMVPFVQQFHAKGQLAPHAASTNNAGVMEGAALVAEGDKHLSVTEALAHFESNFRAAAEANGIVASAVFFHGTAMSIPPKPAQTAEEASTLVALLEHKAGDSVYLVIPYSRVNGSIEYETGKLFAKPAAVFLAPRTEVPHKPTPKPWWRVW